MSLKLQEFLDEHGIQARLIRDIGDTPTVPAAAEALGVPVEQILKTLLFLLDEGAAEARPVVVISHGTKRIAAKKLAAHFGVGRRRIKFAPADVVLEQLGYPAGGVPPFGHEHSFELLLDRSILDLPQSLLYAGGGDDQTMLEIERGLLLELLDPTILEVSEVKP